MWEGVGDRTELQHIDSHSSGHNGVSFPFSWAAQPGAWGPRLSGTCSHSSIFTPTHLICNWLTSCLHPGYIIIRRPHSSCGRHKSHSFKLSSVKVIISWYFSTGCTWYLHRDISYFDSLAGSEVNMQQREEKYFAFALICWQNHSKLSQNRSNDLIWNSSLPR